MYIPQERVSVFKSAIMNNDDLADEVKSFVIDSFVSAFDYDPNAKSRVYSNEEYQKMKQKHGGNLGKLECNIRARKKYESDNREEINRRARERYHARKLLSNNSV
jgi:hypothetical protein